jgi:hypothetical protein
MNGQEQAVSGSVTYLLTQGVLGVMLLLSLVFNWYQYKQGTKTAADRLQDAKDVTKEVVTALQANTQSTNVLTAKIETGKREGVL